MVVMIKAVLWDFGGVILTSPFEAFRRYETEHDLPLDFIRSVNTTDPHNNAWALMERYEVTPQQFDDLFAAESAARGYKVAGADVLLLLAGDVRPRMVALLDRVKAAGFQVACLTNNIVGGDSPDIAREVRRHRREQQDRRAQTRAALLRDRLRFAGRRPRRVRLPRRPRHQSEAGSRNGHDHDQSEQRGSSDRRSQLGARLDVTSRDD
jgi:hypothetical protein